MSLRNLFIASLLITANVYTIVPAVWTQSEPDLRRILGHPVTEIYQPEKGITVTASYDEKGQICELRLKGSGVTIAQLADKLVPVNARGRLLRSPQSLIPAMNCCDSFRFEYENVIMEYFLGGDMDIYRFIYKGRKCVAPQPDVMPWGPR
jgi:hypothetical protein